MNYSSVEASTSPSALTGKIFNISGGLVPAADESSETDYYEQFELDYGNDVNFIFLC